MTLTYGNSANEKISGRTIQLTPYIGADRVLVWRCGNADVPSGTPSGVYAAGSVATPYLPMACNPGNGSIRN